MNKRPLSGIDPYSLIVCVLVAVMLTPLTAYECKWQAMAWWARSNGDNKRLWISTRLERSRRKRNTVCETLNYGISCGNTESSLPHGASDACMSSAKARNSPANVVKLCPLLCSSISGTDGMMTVNAAQLVTCCQLLHMMCCTCCTRNLYVPSTESSFVCAKTKLSH